MKPFNLEEYLANPSRKVVTRDGIPAKILYTDARGEYPVIALVEHYQETLDVTFSFTKDGKWCTDGTNSNKDLFFAPEKHEGWVNVYKGGNRDYFTLGAMIYDRKEDAEECRGVEDCVATVKIEWEE